MNGSAACVIVLRAGKDQYSVAMACEVANASGGRQGHRPNARRGFPVAKQTVNARLHDLGYSANHRPSQTQENPISQHRHTFEIQPMGWLPVAVCIRRSL